VEGIDEVDASVEKRINQGKKGFTFGIYALNTEMNMIPGLWWGIPIDTLIDYGSTKNTIPYQVLQTFKQEKVKCDCKPGASVSQLYAHGQTDVVDI
jgi:hypothetical protein